MNLRLNFPAANDCIIIDSVLEKISEAAQKRVYCDQLKPSMNSLVIFPTVHCFEHKSLLIVYAQRNSLLRSVIFVCCCMPCFWLVPFDEQLLAPIIGSRCRRRDRSACACRRMFRQFVFIRRDLFPILGTISFLTKCTQS
jgi:hypothetical protein